VDRLQDSGVDRFLAERAWLFELSVDPMVVCELDGRLRVVNAAYQRLVGLQLDEIIQRPFTDFLHPDEVDRARFELDRLSSDQPLQEFPLCHRDGGGRKRWVSWTMTPSPAENSIYGVGRDITDRREVEEALAVQAEELGRSNADLEQFAYVTSHDLSQPLTVISSYSELLIGGYGGTLSAEACQFVQRISGAAERMTALMSDLLAYSRLGRGDLHRETVDCRELVIGVLADLEVALEGADVVVEELPPVSADRRQLAQVFQNLVANAAAFARPGIRPHIVLGGRSEDGFRLYSVTDNGLGIEPVERKRIFEMFERIERQDDGGNGIGLAICKRVVERHGGRIWVEDAPGGGSRFCFTLPSA
jgi:PAS domain S-box-containing protein